MKIIIVGAGISGLSLAYFLQQKGLDVIVLERDSQFESERQGFSLTMQANTLNIFKEYGLLDEIYQLGHRALKQVFFDHKGNTLYENNNNDNDRFNYPLPRQEIRRVFFKRLKENTVRFGAKVTDIQIAKNCISLKTSLGEFIVDYVIACDGLNSFIRSKLLPDIKPFDLTLCNVYGITDLSQVSKETKDLFNNAEVQVLDGYHRFFSKPFNSQKQMWELTWPIGKDSPFNQVYEKYYQGVNYETLQLESLALCQEAIKDWPLPWLKEFFSASKHKDIIVHPLFDIDPSTIDFSQIPDRVIMIGDTVHPMAPYIGMGANQAFDDAYRLAKLFTQDGVGDIKSFYDELTMRAKKSVLRSRENTVFYHSPDAIDKEKLWEFKNWHHKN